MGWSSLSNARREIGLDATLQGIEANWRTKQMKEPRKAKRSTPAKTSASTRDAKLTVKQRVFVSEKLKGRSSAEAARKAGYSPSVQRRADAIITNSPNVHAAIEALLAQAGISDGLIAQRMFEGLNATVTKFATVEGRITDSQDCIDFKERREMVELVLRLKGLLTNRHQVDLGPTLAELLEESYKDEKPTRV
jgi:hypothetical protein